MVILNAPTLTRQTGEKGRPPVSKEEMMGSCEP